MLHHAFISSSSGELRSGRVQSVALRLIVEREQEIAEFNPVEYWSVEADLAHDSILDQHLVIAQR